MRKEIAQRAEEYREEFFKKFNKFLEESIEQIQEVEEHLDRAERNLSRDKPGIAHANMDAEHTHLGDITTQALYGDQESFLGDNATALTCSWGPCGATAIETVGIRLIGNTWFPINNAFREVPIND